MSDAPYYDSRALTESEWAAEREALLAAGCEYLPPRSGVIYIRLHKSGPKNIESKEWMSS